MAPKHGKTLNQPAYSLRKNSFRLYVNFRVQLPRLDFNSLKSDLFLYNRLTFSYVDQSQILLSIEHIRTMLSKSNKVLS